MPRYIGTNIEQVLLINCEYVFKSNQLRISRVMEGDFLFNL